MQVVRVDVDVECVCECGGGKKQMNERVTVIEEDKGGNLARVKDSDRVVWRTITMDGLLKFLQSRAAVLRRAFSPEKFPK